jgi:hypothetical protein
VPHGRLLLSAAQRFNLHAEHNERYTFRARAACACGAACAAANDCATALPAHTRATRCRRAFPNAQVYEPRHEDELAEVELEVRLLQRQDGSQPAALLHLDAGDVVRALTARSSGHVLAAGEVVVMQLGAHALRLRVAQTDSLDAAARVRAPHTRSVCPAGQHAGT